MSIESSTPLGQFTSASRPPGVPTKIRGTSWVFFWPRKPSQYDQVILDDELGHHLKATTRVLPRRKKQQPDTLARLLAAVHAHFPSQPSHPLLEPLFQPSSPLAAVPVLLTIEGLPSRDTPFVIHRMAEIVRPKDDSPVRVEKLRLDIRQEPDRPPKPQPPGLSTNDLSSPPAISFSPLTFKESTHKKAQQTGKPLDLSYLSLDRCPVTPDTPRPIWDSDEEDSDSD